MAELHDPVETGMPRSVKFGIAAVLILIAFAWFLPKKVGNNTDSTPIGEGSARSKDSKSTSDRETERQLAGILQGLSPELVVVSSKRIDRVVELGQWAGEALTKGDAAAVKVDTAANAKWFTGEALKEVNDPTFSLRDGHHITMANLAGHVVTQLLQKPADPLQQIDELFRYVIRHTALAPDEYDTQLPGTAFESLLTGRSTAASRAWALGILLRQLRIDAVILEPKSNPEAWLIGVIAPSGDVLLYDPRLGVGLPTEPGPAGFKKAATLAMVKEKPELLRLLDVEPAKPDQKPEPYPLKAEDLASLNVKLITDSSASSERMARLQTMITGTLMEVFDGVGKSQLREQGLADRVIAAGAKANAWSAADVAVWAYPEKQSDAFMSSGAEDSKAWRGITNVFKGPVILMQERLQTKNESDASTKTKVGWTSTPLRLVRVDHLKGRLTEALRSYGSIRDASQRIAMATGNPELQQQLAEARPLNRKAAEFAIYWIAACQLERDPRLVRNTIESYLRLYPEGEMFDAIPDLLATAMAEAGDQASAVKFLEEGQRTPRREVLLKMWRQPAAASEKPAEPAP